MQATANQNDVALAAEFKSLLSTQNRGVRKVEVINGIVSVYVSSRRALTGVTTDLRLSRAFSSIKAEVAPCQTMYVIHATVK